jgi:hypothetical protein
VIRRKIAVSAGRPYGHVPGHSYLDVDMTCRAARDGRWLATVTIVWGSARGGAQWDQEHGRVEYAATGSDARAAIERAQREALSEEKDEETRRYIHTACAQVLERAA